MKGRYYCIPINCPNSVSLSFENITTPSVGSFLRSENHHLGVRRFAKTDIFFRGECFEGGADHHADGREGRFGFGGEDEKGAFCHVEIGVDCPTWGM